MDTSNVRQPAAANKLASIDVSQLDKINAIPNKTSDNVLMDGLCQEDQLYLSALMDDDSSDSDDDERNHTGHRRHGAAWSTVQNGMHNPPIMSKAKRMRKMRSSNYAITLSLEDISYIRPSWGLSKGKVVNRKKRKRQKTSGGGGAAATAAAAADPKQTKSLIHQTEIPATNMGAGDATKPCNSAPKTKEANNPMDNNAKTTDTGATIESEKDNKRKFSRAYHCMLAAMVVLVIVLIVSAQLINESRLDNRMRETKLQLLGAKKVLKLFKPNSFDPLVPLLSVHFGKGIPNRLKYDECSCDTYNQETRLYNPNVDLALSQLGECYACLDWAMRANLQIYIKRSKKSTANPINHHNQQQQQQAPISSDPTSDTICYNFRWQSYDKLETPLIDCIELGGDTDEQWFGLGDILHTSSTNSWLLNKMRFSSSPLITNLSSEFGAPPSPSLKPKPKPTTASSNNNNNNQSDEAKLGQNRPQMDQLIFGSRVEFKLFSSAGVGVDNLNTDFIPSLEISPPQSTNGGGRRKRLCLSVECGDWCSNQWAKLNKLDQLQFENNIVQYRICTDSNWRDLVARQFARSSTNFFESHPINEQPLPPAFDKRQQQQLELTNYDVIMQTNTNNSSNNDLRARPSERLVEVASESASRAGNGEPIKMSSNTSTATHLSSPVQVDGMNSAPAPQPTIVKRSPEKIGLIERTIFITSPEFMPTLDGQTLRHYADNIVKLGLKTSPILVVDTRWETFVGSLRLNTILFPRMKLLFEILHNKGFKIVLSIKPYIDTSIGISGVGKLLEANRLCVNRAYHQYGTTTTTANTMLSHPANQNKRTAGDRMHAKPINEQQQDAGTLIRRESFFVAKNETIIRIGANKYNDNQRAAHVFKCRESSEGYCVLIDVSQTRNRLWLRDAIRRSQLLAQDADGLLVGGAHPDGRQWDDDYRRGLGQLVESLFHEDAIYALSQWTGNFKYIQLAPRHCEWASLRSMVNSVLNLSSIGFALVHPGSVWGDSRPATQGDLVGGGGGGALMQQQQQQLPDVANQAGGDYYLTSQSMSAQQQQQQTQARASKMAQTLEDESLASIGGCSEELAIRWLQVAVFMPILQFNNLEPIEKFALNEHLQSLIRMRRLQLIPELKKNLPATPLVAPQWAQTIPPAQAQPSQAQTQAQAQAQAQTQTQTQTQAQTQPPPTPPTSATASASGPQASPAPTLQTTATTTNKQAPDTQLNQHQLPLIRPTWIGGPESNGTIIGEQFQIGPDLIVAPVLFEAQRQRDIYLPNGLWRDELRQTNVRGGKWLRNYPVELREVAWFTRTKR